MSTGGTFGDTNFVFLSDVDFVPQTLMTQTKGGEERQQFFRFLSLP